MISRGRRFRVLRFHSKIHACDALQQSSVPKIIAALMYFDHIYSVDGIIPTPPDRGEGVWEREV